MGRKWFNKKKKRENKGSKGPLSSRERYENRMRTENNGRDNGAGYVKLLRESKEFEKYYKSQNLVPAEEWDSFIGYMKQDLPAAFRFTGSKTQSHALSVLMQEFFSSIPVNSVDKPLKLSVLPWYPYNLGWQLNLTRKDIRRAETYWKMHQFLIAETETGNISRQETVSMIPPLLLDVNSTHTVLDMCAAPGSKTAQIIEILHSSSEGDSNTIPSGIVIANDVDNKRCYMLTHQAKRLQSPAMIITNHDASAMPNIYYTRKDGSVGPMKFDRILCDVPCSGDGTLRKNFDVWSKWNAVNGANLHGLQLRIARRGLELLKVGGRMVYSTCSLNPLENEAVVNRLLMEFGSSVSLVDAASQLPGLKYTPGLEDWVVMTKDLDVVSSADDIPLKYTNCLNKHLFPPTVEERSKRHLRRCIRILPHHQDTGAFFVAVLQKLAPLPGEKIYDDSLKEVVEEVPAGAQVITQTTKPPPKKRICRGYQEEPFYYMSGADPMWGVIPSFFGIDPSLDLSFFLTRVNTGSPKNIYFTNSLVKDIVKSNENRIKIINTGVKVLVRCDNKGSDCNYRLAQEGLQVIFPFLTDRKIQLKKDDMVALLSCEDTSEPPQIETLHKETQTQCEKMENGSVMYIYEGVGFKEDVPVSVQLVGWKGKKSLRSYVVKNERVHFLRLLGADVSAFEKNKFDAARAEAIDNKTNGATGPNSDTPVPVEALNELSEPEPSTESQKPPDPSRNEENKDVTEENV